MSRAEAPRARPIEQTEVPHRQGCFLIVMADLKGVTVHMRPSNLTLVLVNKMVFEGRILIFQSHFNLEISLRILSALALDWARFRD